MFQLSDARVALRHRAAVLADALRERAAEIDRTERYPSENVAALKQAGFLGMTLPRAHGGQGLGWLDAAIVIEEIAKACAVSARIVVETNMGGVSAIMAYGSEAQQRLAAEMVLGGDKPAICITEPEAGSALRACGPWRVGCRAAGCSTAGSTGSPAPASRACT